MQNIKKLLDAAKAATSAESDYRLAKNLGITQARVSAYYAGKETPNEFACLKIAEALDMPLAQVIATVKAEAEKDEKRREAWKDYLKKLGGIAASVFVPLCASVIFAMTAIPAHAANLLAFKPISICIMLSRRCRSKLQTALRNIGFPCTFGVFIRRISKMPAY